MLNLRLYAPIMYQVGERYGVLPEDILIESKMEFMHHVAEALHKSLEDMHGDPELDAPGLAYSGKLYFPEIIDRDKALPWLENERIREALSSTGKRIEYLMLHEIYHRKHHHRPIHELTQKEISEGRGCCS